MVVAVLYLCGCGCDLYLCGCGCGGQAPSSSFYTGDVGVGDSSLRVHHPVGGAPANTEVCIFLQYIIMAVMLIPELFILYPEPDTAPTFKSSDPGKSSGSGSDPNYFKHDRKF